MVHLTPTLTASPTLAQRAHAFASLISTEGGRVILSRFDLFVAPDTEAIPARAFSVSPVQTVNDEVDALLALVREGASRNERAARAHVALLEQYRADALAALSH